MIFRIVALACIVACPTLAQVSLDELDEAADKKDAAMSEFRKRLNDPDPDRALAVLELLITGGDAMQRRLAIRHGLSSTDRAIRATTLRAIFDSKPTFRAVFVPAAEKPTVYYYRTVQDSGGVIDSKGSGSVNFRVTGYNEDSACWTHGRSNTCLVRVLGGDSVSIWFGKSWGNYVLEGGTGKLIGEQSIANNLTTATIDLSQ